MQQPSESVARIARLMDRHGRALVYYASQWTASAEDCVQEAFVELARRRSEPERVAAWLFRVVRNRALNAARAERRRRRHERAAAELRSPPAPRLAEDRDDLLAAVERLDGPMREIVVLRVWSGLKAGRRSPGWRAPRLSTAHRRYVAALERLREMLEEPCPTETESPNTAPCPKR